nr:MULTISPECIES: GntR family transcriptional regulator [unclassified Micrococcus]
MRLGSRGPRRPDGAGSPPSLEPAAVGAARRVRERIAAAQLAPGTRLGEVALAAELGVSRNSLREAFAALAAERLLVRIPHRGVFVAHPTEADVSEIFRTRRVIELSALRWGSPDRIAVEELAEIARLAADADREPRLLGDVNHRLHAAIVRLLDSRDLEAVMDGVLARLRLAFQPMDVLTDLHPRFAARNRRLAELIADGELESAAEILGPYLDEAEHTVLEHLGSRGGRPGPQLPASG